MGQSAKHLDASGVVMSLAAYVDTALHSLFEGSTHEDSAEIVKRADHARDRKDWRQAARGYAAAISSGDGRAGLKVQLGHALKEMGDFDGAERMYHEFLQANPQNEDIYLQLGHLFNKRGDLINALSFYEQAEKLAPLNPEIVLHANLARKNAGRIDVVQKREAAMALVSAELWEEAQLLLSGLVSEDGETDLMGILANVTKETGRLDDAAALYSCYLDYADSSNRPELKADGHLQLGHLYKIKGDYSVAVKHFLNARHIERANEDYDPDASEVEREITVCLREIYPCFVFQGR